MCDHFVGTWKLLSSENFEDYMKELGENCILELLYLGKGRNAEFELYSLLFFFFFSGSAVYQGVFSPTSLIRQCYTGELCCLD